MTTELVNYIFTKKPTLKRIAENYGELSLYEYGEKFFHGTLSDTPLFQKRKSEFLDILRNFIQKKFGPVLSEEAVNSLEKNYCVSTADHHGPLGHPFFFQSSILRGLVGHDEAIVNLCTSHVSLGNSSQPRGLLTHSTSSNEQLLLPLSPARDRMCPVYGYPAREESDIQKYFIKRLEQFHTKKILSEEKYNSIRVFAEKNLLSNTLLSAPNYSDQSTLLNFYVWKDLFSKTLPSFISLDAETLVTEILIEQFERNTLFGLSLNISIFEDIEKLFDGIQCCFNRKEKTGTYLFWYLDKKRNRHALRREGNTLINDGGTISIELSSNCLSKELLSGNLIPSGLLVYGVFAGYYGLTCFGGFSQGDYLPRILEAYRELTKQELFHKTTGILCEDMVFVKNGEQILTALDMISIERMDRNFLLEKAKSTTLDHSLECMISEIARCL